MKQYKCLVDDTEEDVNEEELETVMFTVDSSSSDSDDLDSDEKPKPKKKNKSKKQKKSPKKTKGKAKPKGKSKAKRASAATTQDTDQVALLKLSDLDLLISAVRTQYLVASMLHGRLEAQSLLQVQTWRRTKNWPRKLTRLRSLDSV